MCDIKVKTIKTTTNIVASDGLIKCQVTIKEGEVTGVSFSGPNDLQTEEEQQALIEAVCDELKKLGCLTKDNLLALYAIA